MLIWCPILHSLAHDEAQTLFGYRMDLYLHSLCAFWDLSTACMTTDIRGAVGGQVSPPCTSIFHSGCRVFFTGPYGLYNPYVLMPMQGPINKIKTKFLVKTVLRHPSNFMCGTSSSFFINPMETARKAHMPSVVCQFFGEGFVWLFANDLICGGLCDEPMSMQYISIFHLFLLIYCIFIFLFFLCIVWFLWGPIKLMKELN